MKSRWSYKFLIFLKKIYFKNDKRVAAYLVCVVIATGFWFLNALSKTYTVDITVPVNFINYPDNKTLLNKPPKQLDLRIKAHGFTILRYKVNFFFLPLTFDVNKMTSNRMQLGKKSNYTFPSRQFLSAMSYELSNELEILSMNPDTLYFRFGEMGQKKVAVKPNMSIDLKKQYRISGKVQSMPDSVIINGPQSILDTIRFIPTEKKLIEGVDQNKTIQSALQPLGGLFYEPPKVDILIPAEEYTEAQLSVPVSLQDKPEHLNIRLFPARVKLTFLVGLSRFPEMHPEDFKLTVSYSDIQEGKQRLRITAQSTPDYLYDLKIIPEEIEYLIEEETNLPEK